MSLISELRKNDKKNLFGSDDAFATYSTGILPLDYANGFIYKSSDGSVEVPVLGIVGGTFSTFIGYSGSGKTTLAQQMAWNIIKDFDNGLMVHFDVEQTAIKARILQITGADENDERIVLKKKHVSIEDVLDMLDKVCEAKEEMGDSCMYELPKYMWKDPKKPEKVYEPTVFIIDSLAAFSSRERKEEVLEGQMSTGREVGQISQFYTKCLNRMARYNVSIFAINHIKAKVETNPYQSSPAQLVMLRPGESLPRGYAPIYYAQNVFRCSTNKSSMYTMEDNRFTGFRTVVGIVKSKSSFVGGTINACFNSEIGFDPIYSMYEFADQMGLIEGRNPHLYLKGMDAFKFNRKDFRLKFVNEADFRNGFMSTIQPYLDNMLNRTNSEADNASKVVTVSDLMNE